MLNRNEECPDHGSAYNSAFAQYYELNYQKIYLFLLGKVNVLEDAEDLTATTFTEIYQLFGEILSGNIQNLDGYLYTITKNKLKDFYRSKYIKTTDQGIPVSMPDIGIGAEQEVVLLERKASVESALLGLYPGHAQILRSRYLEDLDYEEIGAKYNLSFEQVKSRVDKAKKAMRRDAASLIQDI